MRKTMLLAAGLGFFALGSGANALPLPAQPDVATVQTVAQGCGWGYHRGPWGGCRPNGAVVVAPGPVVVAPRVVVPGPVVVAPRHCWWRNGPYGAVRVCN
ncbi:hypothetical protein EZH22_07985 [Xanthobacter dioxanivorans]|uniref:Uncharacterized protein n=1 Tax=Xanthobacter dioxanivorans TaxID=2528964 RepID=A0A974PS17_9HYPH|nr:hypothetical protein [Xanthobacter dioxanivorans]QRG08238.1 hypothetical protein EZH22_07985 [Xanthobacter dioxanivorans]